MNIEIENLAAVEAFGRRLGAAAFPGAVVALDGPLGAGKTHLVRAIAEGLQIENPALVTSPTYVLIQEYAARLPIFHFDAYRLKNDAEFRDLGVEEYFAAGGVCLIEWAERVDASLPWERLNIHINPIDENRRELTIEAIGERYMNWRAEIIAGDRTPPHRRG
jgi:tRNA threonylcarbamoyladenosine biosynthesis protein TsaE